ncbi:MAG: oligosaccharide flippase family protein [Deltaproteobacteria bacterium]|nr:oligosaccharide flippase family protein [Deltaproteobacteria bacterium]
MKPGTIAILVARLVFLVAGYALVVGLTHFLAPADFGLYSLVNGIVALVNMVLMSGAMQTVSHFVAADDNTAPRLRPRFLVYQAIIAGLAVGGLGALSYVLPGFFKEPSVGPLLQIALFIPAACALYAVNVGYLNGHRCFVRQAALDILFSILKVSAMLTLAGLGFGVMGVFGGFAIAAITSLIASFLLTQNGAPCPSAGAVRGATTGFAPAAAPSASSSIERVDFMPFAQYAVPIMGVALLLNAVFHADLFLLKNLTRSAQESGALTGVYAAAQQIARIPYYGMGTVGIIVFPSIAALSSKHTVDRPAHRSNRGRVADIGSAALGGALNLMLGMSAIAMPLSGELMHLIYPELYQAGATALAVLIASAAALTILYLATTVISSAGFPRVSLLFLSITLTLQTAFALMFIPKWSMVGAAFATLAASSGVACLALRWLRVKLDVQISAFYLARCFLAASIPGALACAFHAAALGASSRIATLIFLMIDAMLFIVLSLVLGTLRPRRRTTPPNP